ncbi:MAG: sugar ABC transporter permease, partial [Chloroflexi bacterium]
YTVITLSHFSENKVIKYIAARIYDVEGGIGYASAMAFLYSLALIVLLVATFMVLRPRVKD